MVWTTHLATTRPASMAAAVAATSYRNRVQLEGLKTDMWCCSPRLDPETIGFANSAVRSRIDDSVRKTLHIDAPCSCYRISISVADPCHFGVDPDPRIHASD
jgi:hypothetical protein